MTHSSSLQHMVYACKRLMEQRNTNTNVIMTSVLRGSLNMKECVYCISLTWQLVWKPVLFSIVVCFSFNIGSLVL